MECPGAVDHKVESLYRRNGIPGRPGGELDGHKILHLETAADVSGQTQGNLPAVTPQSQKQPVRRDIRRGEGGAVTVGGGESEVEPGIPDLLIEPSRLKGLSQNVA